MSESEISVTSTHGINHPLSSDQFPWQQQPVSRVESSLSRTATEGVSYGDGRREGEGAGAGGNICQELYGTDYRDGRAGEEG